VGNAIAEALNKADEKASIQTCRCSLFVFIARNLVSNVWFRQAMPKTAMKWPPLRFKPALHGFESTAFIP
jgi:hypothetical protein